MSDKNIYESMRDDAREVTKNAVGCVLAVAVAIVIVLAMIVKAIIIVVVHLLFYAAIIVLLAIPLYVVLEVFYYRVFAHFKRIPIRYHRRRARSESRFRATVGSRMQLERRIRLLSDADQRRLADELELFRVREAQLCADTRHCTSVEANWIRERLTVIQLKRLAVLRRVSKITDAELHARLSAFDDEAAAFESRLRDLKTAYDIDPDEPDVWNGQQPWVAYIRVALHSPLRIARREASAPRISLLLAEWPILVIVLVAAALSSVIVAGVFSAGLPRW